MKKHINNKEKIMHTIVVKKENKATIVFKKKIKIKRIQNHLISYSTHIN